MSHNNLREWVEKNYATSLEPKIYFVLIVIFLDKFEEKAISNYEVFNNENGSAHKDTLHMLGMIFFGTKMAWKSKL